MMLMILLISISCLVFFISLAKAIVKLQEKPTSLAARARSVQEKAGTKGGTALRDEEEMDKSLVTRVLLPLAGRSSGVFSSITPVSMLKRADENILQAGLSEKVTGIQLMTLSWIFTFFMPAFIFIIFMPSVAQHKVSMSIVGLGCLFGAFLGYRMPLGIVQSRAKKRQKEIQLALPFTFDLISVSVSAGMAFDGAMQVVSERTSGSLSEELRRTLREINLGISRDEALNNLVKRTGVDDLRSFVAAVNYISKLGGSLVSVIEVQTDALRVKRRQRAEKKANQAPVKIMIPLVLFIFPCLFIVILGPAVVTLLTKNMPF
jgi:tight adherence protein C